MKEHGLTGGEIVRGHVCLHRYEWSFCLLWGKTSPTKEGSGQLYSHSPLCESIHPEEGIFGSLIYQKLLLLVR